MNKDLATDLLLIFALIFAIFTLGLVTLPFMPVVIVD
jgi:hypothetical protein